MRDSPTIATFINMLFVAFVVSVVYAFSSALSIVFHAMQ